MSQEFISSSKVRLPSATVIMVCLAGCMLAVLMGFWAGGTQLLKIWAVLLAIGGVTVTLLLGSRFWLLIPLSFVVDLPAFPLFGRSFMWSELAIAACTVVYIIRIALKKASQPKITSQNLWIWAYFLWVVVIYIKNPVGLTVMGSDVAGAREYARIGIALVGFLIISSQTIQERDARFLIYVMLFAPFLTSAWGIAQFFLGIGVNQAEADGFYTWHQALSAPANAMILFLFSKYPIREIFSLRRPWAIFAIAASLLMVGFSGKRAVAGTMLVTPMLAALIRKNYTFASLYSVFAAVGIAFMVIGHNHFFTLPMQTQRVLMNLPGDWDSSLKNYVEEGGDNFRHRMRELAKEQFAENPILGTGLGIELRDVIASLDVVGGSEDQTTLLALGSSWHSAWLGILADFGAPAAVFMALFALQRLFLSYRVFKSTKEGTTFHTLAIILLIWFLQQLMRSYTSGTAVSAPLDWWWGYAILLGVQSALADSQATRRIIPSIARGKSRLDNSLEPSIVKTARSG